MFFYPASIKQRNCCLLNAWPFNKHHDIVQEQDDLGPKDSPAQTVSPWE